MIALALARIFIGFIFLWAFFDKLLGLGFATSPDKAWILGGSPTTSFLANAVHGPLVGFYNILSGVAFVDWIFMIGLLVVGISLTIGIATRLGSYFGIIMLMLMWSALLPPSNNPIIDDHIIYSLVLLVIIWFDAGKVLGLQKKWEGFEIVKKIPLLK